MKHFKNLPLDRMSNCRDLGGYPTKYGTLTKFGVFLRSEAPVELTKRDIAMLLDYGVKKSLDFRGDGDLVTFPSSLDKDGVEYVHLPMFGRADALGFESDGEDPSKGFSGWGKSYIQWIECYKGWIRDVFRELASTDGVCQFNCNAGKDRTGIISALILAVCGVGLSDIAFDYNVSRAMLKPRFPQLARQWGDYLKDEGGKLIPNHPFLYTPKEAMIQLFQYIYSKYSTAEKYLLSCGVTEDEIETIRKKLAG